MEKHKESDIRIKELIINSIGEKNKIIKKLAENQDYIKEQNNKILENFKHLEELKNNRKNMLFSKKEALKNSQFKWDLSLEYLWDVRSTCSFYQFEVIFLPKKNCSHWQNSTLRPSCSSALIVLVSPVTSPLPLSVFFFPSRCK